MVGQRGSQRSRWSERATARQVVGLGASAAAFLAFGLTPLTTVPTANADELDVIFDPLITALTAQVDPAAAVVDPAAGLDVTHALSAEVTPAVTALPEEISKNGVVIVDTCLIGGVQECTATTIAGQHDTATAIGYGSTATAEGGPGDVAYADDGQSTDTPSSPPSPPPTAATTMPTPTAGHHRHGRRRQRRR